MTSAPERAPIGATPPARVAVVNSHPIQYFAPLYAYLDAAPDVELTALYLSDFSLRGEVDRGFGTVASWDLDLLAGYGHKYVGADYRTASPYGFFALRTWRIFGEISRKRYDAVWLHGHGYAAYVIALLAARLKGVPVFMRSDAHLGYTESSWKAKIRRPALRLLYSQCACMLAVGTANRDLYRAMGVPEDRIVMVPYAVDNDRFARDSALTPDQRRAWRAKLGVADDAPILLFASKFMRRKCPDDLLAAFAMLQAEGSDAHLVFVGSGEMDAELRATVATQHLANVHFPGFVNQGDLPKVFAASDVFVLPSKSEPWGLIINEVMNAGLPVVVADEVGAAPDLALDGVNGKTFPAGDVDALAAALRPLIADPALRARMGTESRRIIGNFGFAQCLDGLRAALSRVRARRR